MSFPSSHVGVGVRHLRSADPVLNDLIERVGPFRMKVDRNRFRALVYSIIAQQISGSAARSIRQRLEELLRPDAITPEALAGVSVERLRRAGLSARKAGYLLDLARKVERREIRLRSLVRMPDEDVIQELVQVKGIGLWTAQMFLMFSLARLDVFPHADLGIRSALRNLYRLDDLPDTETSHRIAAKWRPYATFASWYCWRSLDLSKAAAV
jgi:DNA-3-methyladenine glycosylase II